MLTIPNIVYAMVWADIKLAGSKYADNLHALRFNITFLRASPTPVVSGDLLALKVGTRLAPNHLSYVNTFTIAFGLCDES